MTLRTYPIPACWWQSVAAAANATYGRVRDLYDLWRYSDPPVLYKQRHFSNPRHLDILRNREIFFAAPAALNDPLDLSIDPGPYLDDLITRQYCSSTRARLTRLRDQGVREIATGKPVKVHEAMHNLTLGAGVFCASRTCTDLLMWSHYSYGHTGFCLGFDGTYFVQLRDNYRTNGMVGFGPVKYAARLNVDRHVYRAAVALAKGAPEWFDSYRSEMLVAVLTTKASSWQYEQEFRCVRGRPGTVPFEPSAIREVVFGANTPATREREVRDILAGPQWAHVAYKRVRFKPPHKVFGLEVIDA